MKDKETLRQAIKKYSIKTTGEYFELSSGTESNIYIDLKKTAQRNDIQNILARFLSNAAHSLSVKMLLDEESHVDFVAGVALGGCHLASIVSFYSRVYDGVLYIRNEIKTHGTKQLIEGPEFQAEQTVILIEDVITTGNSSLKAAQILEDAGLIVIGIVAVVDRRDTPTNSLGPYHFQSLFTLEELRQE